MSFSVSHSDISSFKRCRRQWYWSSKHGLNLRPRKPSTALYLGKSIHKALEEHYDPASEINPLAVYNNWCEERRQEIEEENEGLFPEEEEELDEEEELGRDMLRHYLSWAEDEDEHWFDEVIDTEIEFELPIPTPKGNRSHGTVRGRFDGLVRDQAGRVWVKEFKTASRIQTDHLQLDEQSVTYCWAAQELYGEEVQGLIYTYLLKKRPGTPNTTKSGKLSRRKIKSTYDHMRNAIIEHHGGDDQVPWSYYSDLMQHYKEQDSNPFFQRERIRKNQYEIEDIQKRIYQVYRQMRSASNDEDLIYPEPQKQICSWCRFKDPCLAKNDGSDYEWLLENEYVERDRG